MQRKQYIFRDVDYIPLKSKLKNDDCIEDQFRACKENIPVKSVCLACLLFMCGLTLLTAGTSQLLGFFDEKYADRTWPLLIMGTIMFVPGAYYVRIAYCAYYRYPGYSFEDIPEFD